MVGDVGAVDGGARGQGVPRWASVTGATCLVLVAVAIVVDEARSTWILRHVLFRDYGDQVRVGHSLGWVGDLLRSAALVVGLVVVALVVLRGSRAAGAAGAVLLAGFAIGWVVIRRRAFDGAGDVGAVPVIVVALAGAVVLARTWGSGRRSFGAADGLEVVRLVLLPTCLGFLPFVSDLVGYFTGPTYDTVQAPFATLLLVAGAALALVGIGWLRPGQLWAALCTTVGALLILVGVVASPLHFFSDSPPGTIPVGWWAALLGCALAVALLVLLPSVRSLAWSGGSERGVGAAVAGLTVVVLSLGLGIPGLVHASQPPRFCAVPGNDGRC